MTDEELKQLVASLAVSHQETERFLREHGAETDRRLQESRAETDRRLRESRVETDRFFQESRAETDRFFQESKAETDRLFQESRAETDRQLREVSTQLGQLGNKFGSFTEGMAYPSMRKLLQARFGADFVGPRISKAKNGRTLEVDVLAYTNSGRNAAYVVEVKSHLRPEGIQQMLRILREFPEFYPEHRDKQLYGILAVVDASDDLRQQVLEQGLYLAEISGEAFELRVPAGFVARSFQQPAA